MQEAFRLELDKESIRFTADGKFAVLDAIRAFSGIVCPEYIWESLKLRYPYLEDLCQDYPFQEKTIFVVDIKGWDKIEELLLDYLLDRGSE